jgi:hypothetical protein
MPVEKAKKVSNYFCFHTYEISFSIIDVILLINFIFLSSKLNVPTLNTKCSFLHALDFKEMARIVTKQQNGLNFGRRKTLWKSTLIFNYRIIDGYIEFPNCMLLFDNSNERSIQLDTAVT